MILYSSPCLTPLPAQHQSLCLASRNYHHSQVEKQRCSMAQQVFSPGETVQGLVLSNIPLRGKLLAAGATTVKVALATPSEGANLLVAVGFTVTVGTHATAFIRQQQQQQTTSSETQRFMLDRTSPWNDVVSRTCL